MREKGVPDVSMNTSLTPSKGGLTQGGRCGANTPLPSSGSVHRQDHPTRGKGSPVILPWARGSDLARIADPPAPSAFLLCFLPMVKLLPK